MSANNASIIDACIEKYREKRHPISLFGKTVRDFFIDHPLLTTPPLPVVHSVRFRLKDDAHLRDKIERKLSEGRSISPETLLKSVNDLAGVRVLHLHLEQFRSIDNAIREHVKQGHWHFFEPPKAYTWDPESIKWFESLGLEV
jgi:putative GTP pyrophosphokinase